jgi:hypothetical protein
MAAKAMPKWTGVKRLKLTLKKRGAKNPDALAAWIGRKKYSPKVYNKAAAAGTSLRNVKPYHKMPAYKPTKKAGKK